ncbi:Zinc finger BED domain-containing protein 5 [Araneus ventricosus]|uniref:Zinc finger BED domain-containing protein 5 n=1 Tax=Araneus ventricosus TaxID=182803 RepID=A0A4Y2Q136_ARAVE|nr:Zinc finger BED domain-containing protein 5 [Araneus ventricosus]
MDKWLKTGTLKRSASRPESRTTDLAVTEITVDQQDDNHELQRLNDSPVQVDKSTDVSDISILLVIARYLNVNELEENLLLCYPLTKRCIDEDIFNAIQGYFCENEMDWAKCCVVCTEDGKSVSVCYKGSRGRIKIVAPHVIWSYCCIHRQSLAAKPLPYSLKEVLNQSDKVVNFIKANSTNTRLFKSLCGDMGSRYFCTQK